MATELTVLLNVGGKVFMTTRHTLQAYPDTLLGRIVSRKSSSDSSQGKQIGGDNPPPTLQLSFDRNPKMVNSLLDFYRTGELHLPRSLCSAVVERELRFWGVPVQMIKECCWRKFENDLNDARITEEIDGFLKDKFVSDASKRRGNLPLGTRIWLTMEHSSYSRWAKLWNRFYYSLVALSLLVFFLDSVVATRALRSDMVSTILSQGWAHNMSARGLDPVEHVLSKATIMELFFMTEPRPTMYLAELVCYGCFFIEFSLRLAVCPKRKLFFKQLKNVVDAFLFVHYLVLQLVENVFHPMGPEDITDVEKMALVIFYSLTLVRVFRVIIFAREYSETQIMALVARASRRYFLQLFILVLAFVSLFGTLMYIVEIISAEYSGKVTAFVSIPAGLWWAVVTMTTVGYGDLYPVSVAGQCVGALCALMGVVVLAAPVGMLGYRFSDYHRNMSSQKQKQNLEDFLHRNPGWTRKKPVDVTKRDPGKDITSPSGQTAWDPVAEVTPADTPPSLGNSRSSDAGSVMNGTSSDTLVSSYMPFNSSNNQEASPSESYVITSRAAMTSSVQESIRRQPVDGLPQNTKNSRKDGEEAASGKEVNYLQSENKKRVSPFRPAFPNRTSKVAHAMSKPVN